MNLPATHALRALGLLALMGCSSESTQVTNTDAGPDQTQTQGDDAGDDASPSDGGADVKIDSALPASKPVDPKPPSGTTMCKSGTFTAAEATAACSAGNNGFGCDGVATSGGRWEVWCGTGTRWIWVRFDDARATGTLQQECSLPAPFDVRGFYNTTSAEGGTSFGQTGSGSLDPGKELSRPEIDSSLGNQAAVFEQFGDGDKSVTLSLIADCPKLGQVDVSPLKMTISF